MSYVSTILAEASLLRYYRLNDAPGSSTAADSGPNAQTGTVAPTVTFGHADLLTTDAGTGATFDGASGAISLPTAGLPTGNGAWTMETWLYATALPPSSPWNPAPLLFAGGNNTTRQRLEFYVDHSGFLTIHDGGVTITASTAITLNQPHYAVMTWDGSTFRLYLDAQLVGSGTEGALNIAFGTAYIGHSPDGVSTNNLTQQEVAVYNTALSAGTITVHYHAGAPLLAPGAATLSAGADAAVTAYGTLATTLVAGANGPYVVTVGGQPVDVEAGTLDFIGEIGQRSQGSFTAKTALGVHWDYGTQLQVVDGAGHLVYNGFVAQDQVTLAGWAGGAGTWLAHAVTTMDMHYLADKRLAYASFLGQTAGAIVRALFGAYLQPEGVTLGPCQDGPLIPQKVWTGEPVSKCLDWLCQQTGYWWQIDANRVLWFLPSGSMPAPYVLDGSQVSQDDKLSVTWGNRQYRNRQFVDGGYDKTGTLTETFHGNGSTRAFTCSYEIAEIASITLDGASQGFDKKGATGQPFYYAVGDATLAQDPGGTLLTSGNTLVVTYKGRYPVRALAQNPDSIAQQRVLEGGGTGYVEVAQQDTTIKTLDAGFTLAAAQLAHYAQSMTVLVWQALAPAAVGIAQGQLLHVNLPMLGLTMDMLVKSVEITDVDGINIWFLVTCLGGPQDVTWQTFFQNLMNQATGQLEDPANVATTTLAVLSQWSAACAWAASFTFTPNPSPTWPGAATYPQTTLLPG